MKPAATPPQTDFSAGGTPARPSAAPRRKRWRRAGRWLLGLGALLLALGALAWWWTGSGGSLASTLARAAQYLPAGQRLESRDVQGTLRRGGHIGWLRWSSPTLAVEVSDLRLGWQWLPLLRGRLELGELHAAHIEIAPQGPASTTPMTAPTTLALPLPLQITLPIRVDRLHWTGTPAVDAQGLTATYRYTGQHQLQISQVTLAQGRYSASATLGAQVPLALDATVVGQVEVAAPGGGSAQQVTTHATLRGTLATAAAALQLNAQLQAAESAQSTVDSIAKNAITKSPPDASSAEAMQADLQATLMPWASQPLQQAQATLRAVDLASLWPQAPATLLDGTLRAGPTVEKIPDAPDGAGWAITAQLVNHLPGPWNQARLPLTALQASARFDGNCWSLPAATASVGTGGAILQGHYTPATGAIDGQAELRNLRPDALHTAFDATPIAGRLSAQSRDGIAHFAADIHATTGTGTAKHPALLRIDSLSAQGQWQVQTDGGTLQFERLRIAALQARLEASALRIGLGAAPSVQGQVQLSLPGATAQASGQLAPHSGAGAVQVQASDAQRAQQWLARLPGLASLLPGIAPINGIGVQGQAQLSARWQGGWQTLAHQLQARRSASAPPPPAVDKSPFTLQATLSAPQLDLTLPPDSSTATGGAPWQLRGLSAKLAGSLAQATLALSGEARSGTLRLAAQTRITGGLAAATQWQAQISQLYLQARDSQRPGSWALELVEPLALALRTLPGTATVPSLSVQASAGQARLTGPLPGSVALRWQPAHFASGPGRARLQTQGSVQGLPLAWVDALEASQPPQPPPQTLLARLGLGGDMVFDGQWNIDTGDTLRARASLQRARGDLRVRLGEAAMPGNPQDQTATGMRQAGVHQAELTLEAEGEALRARLLWNSDRAGTIDASASTRIALGAGLADLAWPADAPVAANVRARLPDVGTWSMLAPPGWRVRGTLDANASLSGNRNAPRWAGTLAADDLTVRSILDGVDLQNGRLRATLRGNQLDITEWRIQGGRGSKARIPGLSGNRTAAPQDGGTLSGTGRLSWNAPTGDAQGGSGIAMQLQAEARALQVLARADRQVSVSGPLQAQLQQGQITLRGKLTIDRATILLPDETTPHLGSDVVMRSAAKDRAAQAQDAAPPNTRVQAARPPDIAISLDLGRDFALQGQGITTRLTGQLDIRSSAAPGAQPRVTGEVHTEQGRYRAWGQMLDIETGLIRFNGPYDNPALDILALRPNISVRAGVQISGSAQAPRVRLYSDPELPDAEKLSWVVLGRDAANGGTQAAMLQQAALSLLGRSGGSPGAHIASRLGLDEIGVGGPRDATDANTAALALGKRLSDKMYVTYEYGLTNALGTLYIFFDLTRHLTLRGQTGGKSAVDLIYTLRRD